MKTNKNYHTKISVIIYLIIINFSFSQSVTFPANRVYTNGLMASNRNGQDAVDNYAIWKANFIEACTDGKLRVKFDNAGQTVSEGVAYGMLLSAYATDRPTFDGLWKYYKSHLNANGVMNWKINGCTGVIGNNGATDAEIDAAMALIVADAQWGSLGTINYKNEATSLITIMKNTEVEASTFVLKPGDAFGGSRLTNPSYFAPGYFRKFASFTGDNFWISVSNKCYEIINNNLTQNNAVAGLVSDWCTATGSHSSEAGGYVNGGRTYNYDASRTPWRIAVDYAWYGNTDAKTYIKKCSDFIRVTKGGTKNIVDGYNQDGSNLGRFHNATFIGAFASAATGGENQTHLNESYADLISTNEPRSYFNQTLKTLYLFFLSGNFYLPGNSTVVVTPPIAVTSVTLSPTNFNLNIGETRQLTANILPNNATNKSVTYSSSNTGIATVNNSGLITAISNGTATITVTTIDGNKTSTASVTVTRVITPAPTNCSFGAPTTSNSLTSFNRITFNKLFIFGTGGPNASKFKKFQINWNPTTNSLGQFAYTTSDGIPAFYNDLRTKITQTFGSTSPAVTITNSGINGLDGDYWVTANNGNFVMVSKTRGFTLYFSNATTAPNCNSTSRNINSNEYTESELTSTSMYPNPTRGITTLSVLKNDQIIVTDLNGRIIFEKQALQNEDLEINLTNFSDGIYIVQTINGEKFSSKKLIIQH
jgi:uncharacterized protein YjdB